MDAFSNVIDRYCLVFATYSSNFLSWGQLIFASFLVLNLAWTCLWYAFDKDCFTKSLSAFLKRFVSIMIFYTLMLHPNWLFSILESVQYMGKTLTHIPLDPSSIINKGITLSNKVFASVATSSLLTLGISAIVILIAYLVINFTFISIALDLALTIIITTALISISCFFLGFSALSTTYNIPKQTLDVILGNCFRLLGLYLVVGAGSLSIESITNEIPVKTISFDPYIWVVASCLLFWLLSKNLPNQLARLASISVQDNQGTDSAALTTSAMRTSHQIFQAGKLATTVMAATGVPQLAKVASSALYSAVMQTGKSYKEGSSPIGSVTKGSLKMASDVAKATFGTMSDHVKQTASKSIGGQGIANSHSSINGIAERIYSAAENVRMNSANTTPKTNSQMSSHTSTNQSFPSANTSLKGSNSMDTDKHTYLQATSNSSTNEQSTAPESQSGLPENTAQTVAMNKVKQQSSMENPSIDQSHRETKQTSIDNECTLANTNEEAAWNQITLTQEGQ